MPRWLLLRRACGTCCFQFYRLQRTRFSTVEHVRVPCASSGSITLSLHNINRHPPTSPLAIFIPPFSRPWPGPDPITPLPSCLAEHPTAIINYRWERREKHDLPYIPLHWPTPLHDVLFGYSWLADNLGAVSNDPSGTNGTGRVPRPRSVFVYGSYLGASLAASLALTESHFPDPSRRMTIRGLIAHNGIYNWTMFLPDHPIHRLKAKLASRNKPNGTTSVLTAPTEEDGIFTKLKQQTPNLFADPANLFDPFASPCLFFHSPNLYVPDDFATPLSTSLPQLLSASEATGSPSSDAGPTCVSSSTTTPPTPPAPEAPTASPQTKARQQQREQEDPESASALLARAAALSKHSRPPRKGYLTFPPRGSTLRLPDTLLLYDSPRVLHSAGSLATAAPRRGRKPRRLVRDGEEGEDGETSLNNFRTQAFELAGLMRRSLGMLEVKRRAMVGEKEGEERGDEEVWRREVERRVMLAEVSSPSRRGEGEEGMKDGALGEAGDEIVREWSRDKIDEEV